MIGGRHAARFLSFALLTRCAAPDAHAPPFANLPYQAFSRAAAVAVAEGEWRYWNSPVADAAPGVYRPIAPRDKAERNPGFWQEVGLYWWIGTNAGTVYDRWTGKHDAAGRVFPFWRDGRYAWSAAFLSYVMRMAGAGKRFPYAPDHARYIDYAWQAAHGGVRYPLLLAERPEDYAPRLGDLICAGRGWASGMRYRNLPSDGFFPAHCAIVAGGRPGALDVIGGNVDDAVALTHVPVTASGMLDRPDGGIVDPRYNWFVVLRVLYAR